MDEEIEVVPDFPTLPRGFPVGFDNRVPAIGETGVSQQNICPLLSNALVEKQCVKDRCMFWVELFTHDGEGAKRVGHCAYYWNALQNVEIKQALIRIDQKLEKVVLDHANL